MSLGAVLVIIVAAGDAHNVSAETYVALVAAAQSALPKDAAVRFLSVPDPARAELDKIEERLGARAVVTLTWRTLPGGPCASLRMHVAGDLGWTERTVAFSARDAPSERGRTLGFAIASIWPAPPRPAAPTERVPSSRTLTGDRRLDDGIKSDGSGAASGSVTEPAGRTVRTPASSPANRTMMAPASGPAAAGGLAPRHREVGLGLVGATGIGGPAGGVGGTLDVAWATRETLRVRALLALRAGELAALGAVDAVAVAGVGLEWWPGALASMWGGALGWYGDLLWTGHWIRRRAGSDPANPSLTTPAESHGRMLPGLDVGLSASLSLGPSSRLLLELGGELAFGRTELRTGAQQVIVATIPPARAVGCLLLRYAF